MINRPPPDSNKDLVRYASMGTQLLVGLGIAVFLGLKLDKWIRMPFPLFVWLLPLLVLIALFYQLVKDTSKKKNDGKP